MDDPQDLWDLLRFPPCIVTEASTALDRLKAAGAATFKTRLRQYLLGVGHPTNSILLDSGIITAAEVERHQGDHLLRARLFLAAVTDSNLLPVDMAYHIQVGTQFLFLFHG